MVHIDICQHCEYDQKSLAHLSGIWNQRSSPSRTYRPSLTFPSLGVYGLFVIQVWKCQLSYQNFRSCLVYFISNQVRKMVHIDICQHCEYAQKTFAEHFPNQEAYEPGIWTQRSPYCTTYYHHLRLPHSTMICDLEPTTDNYKFTLDTSLTRTSSLACCILISISSDCLINCQ